jgi:threonine/homoserine/homoserine lactone efflux protein
MAFAEFAWAAFLGAILSHKLVKQKIGRFQFVVKKIMGVVLIVLAIKIALF